MKKKNLSKTHVQIPELFKSFKNSKRKIQTTLANTVIIYHPSYAFS